ncbi:MAG: DUF433 domain-containing protein [Chloroflexi bacterium]|nr:DUF433 domain-containing protein [Chloroflexota bacterium]
MLLPESVALPLRADESGIIRVSGTRLTLETLVAFFRHGETPEQIHEGFKMVPLADVYTVIGYYLTHRAEIDDYLRTHREAIERSRQTGEMRSAPPAPTTGLLARLAKRDGS